MINVDQRIHQRELRRAGLEHLHGLVESWLKESSFFHLMPAFSTVKLTLFPSAKAVKVLTSATAEQYYYQVRQPIA